ARARDRQRAVRAAGVRVLRLRARPDPRQDGGHGAHRRGARRGEVGAAGGAVMRFYLGTHQPAWLARDLGVPLLVSHRRLASRRSLPRATGPWALDSGGFTELSLYGKWRTDVHAYVAAVRRYSREIGNLDWAAGHDWM